ncbi:MAG: ABC transporter substrate-binding protein, partial [candidate division KSB1 bacterium]
EDAEQIFSKLTEQGREQPFYTAALLLQARSAMQRERNAEASEALHVLFDAHPKSRYAEHAHYLLGLLAFKDENYADAASEFAWVLDRGQTPALKNKAAEHVQILFEDYLQLSEIRRRLRRDYLGPDGTGLLALKMAQAELAQGRRAEGQKLVDDFLRLNPNTRFRSTLEQWDGAASATARGIRIGVILPLSGVDAEAGRALHRGIRYAQLGEASGLSSNNGGGASVTSEFVIRDSESSMVGALKAAQMLLEDRSIVALLGEFDDHASSAIAALAQEKNIPILLPVATQRGITTLGEYVFQMNADRERKGRALAEYAYRFLNCRSFVSIAPQDGYGQEMTDGFSAAVDSLGGEIWTQKWYYGEPQDLSRHLKAIRAAAFARKMEDSLKVLGYSGGELSQTLARSTRSRENMVEMLSTPVQNVSAVFLPLYAEDIRLVVYQLSSYNLQGIRLGGEYWQLLELDARKEIQRYLDGTLIASDVYVDWDSERGRNFRNAFRKRMGVTPERFEILGYDAASLLLQCAKGGAKRPDEIRRALAKVSGYIGMKGEISLDNSERANSSVNILQFVGSGIKRVK